MNLKESLIKSKRTKWLNVGCGDNFDEGFYYIDIFPAGVISEKFRDKYFRIDIVRAGKKELSGLGKFDFVRMQHVFEHFTPEDGNKVLINCAYLLKPGGILLLSTPDLTVHIKNYLKDSYKKMPEFSWWADRRIPKDSPPSYYFSVFAHGIFYGGEHKWCYDFEGLLFQLNSTEKFTKIKKLNINDKLANIPFTHNRPEEDLCVIAVKKGIW
jgi:predicted SAM-dependent methyltransferase